MAFAVNSTESFPAGAVLGMETQTPNGLAAFQVRGALPPGVTPLRFSTESPLRLGEPLFLLGFPQMDTAPRVAQRVLSGRRGTLL